MPRTIKVAAIQMNANPTPVADRLERAGWLVAKAAREGAQLLVLPELFNAGYSYDEANYRLVEPPGGPTSAWMKETANRLGVHLAGSLLLLDQDEVYNSLLLFAPDGRVWRYDKNYPWGWERGYFRDGNRITVAETDLGDLGMMLCWDSAHPELWQRYAGRVDMMIVSSCPPDIGNPTYHFPDGRRVTVEEMGPLFAAQKNAGKLLFGEMINQQTAWLGVPAVCTVGSGQIETAIPNGRASLLITLPTAPWLVKYLPQADRMRLSCDMVQGCKVVNASGLVLAELPQEQGEGFIVAEVTLADERHIVQKQPPSLLSWVPYLASDIMLPLISAPLYRRGLRRAWGERMAPVDAASRRWMAMLGLSAAVAFLVGMRWGRRKNRHSRGGK